MIRKLLTLLALCAGLATMGTPARAAVGVIEAGAQVAAVGLACTPDAVTQLIGAAPSARQPVGVGGMCPLPTVTIVVPTIMLQADRAHE